MIIDTLECMVSPKWMSEANCRKHDPDLFYPGDTGRWNVKNVEQALRVCERCPVTMKCLEWALQIGDFHGILGGTTPEMRGSMMRKAVA